MITSPPELVDPANPGCARASSGIAPRWWHLGTNLTLAKFSAASAIADGAMNITTGHAPRAPWFQEPTVGSVLPPYRWV